MQSTDFNNLVRSWTIEEGQVNLFLENQQPKFEFVSDQAKTKMTITQDKIYGLKDTWREIQTAAKENSIKKISLLFEKCCPKLYAYSPQSTSLKFIKNCFDGMEIKIHLDEGEGKTVIDGEGKKEIPFTFDKNVIIQGNPNLTIKDLKEKIEKETGKIENEEFTLVCKGDKLEDHRTLIYYEITDGTTLYKAKEVAVNNNKINTEFDFNKLEKEKKIPLAKSGPDFRKVTQGLNLLGTCREAGCPAKGKYVWIRLGIDKFNLPMSIFKANCPMGNHKPYKIDNIGFLDCYFTIDGGKQDGTSINIQRQEAGKDEVITYKNGDNCKWVYLEVTTERRGDGEKV